MSIEVTFYDLNTSEDGLRFYVSATPMVVGSLPVALETTGPATSLTAAVGVGPSAYVHQLAGWDADEEAYVRIAAFKAGEQDAVSAEMRYRPAGLSAYGHYRLYVTRNSSDDGVFVCNVAELELMGQYSGINEAVGGAPLASSAYSAALSAAKAFDGDPSTLWSVAADASLPVWLAYALPFPLSLSSIALSAGDNSTRAARAPRDFKLQGSLDGSEWVDLLTVTGETDWAAGERRTFPIP